MIDTASGCLEAALRQPRGKEAMAGAVLCHPHPQFGGTMDNRVIYRAGLAAVKAGAAALRFNFRGVGSSTGIHDGGRGEQEDVLEAIGWLAGRFPRLPLVVIGYSFGAWVGLTACSTDPRVGALVGLGVPLSHYDFGILRSIHKPSLLVVGEFDEFCSPRSIEQLRNSLQASSSLRVIEGADHFFEGQLDQVENLVTEFISQWLT